MRYFIGQHKNVVTLRLAPDLAKLSKLNKAERLKSGAEEM